MTKTEDKPDMKVLKTATCKTLSGKATLTCQIGVAPDSKSICASAKTPEAASSATNGSRTTPSWAN